LWHATGVDAPAILLVDSNQRTQSGRNVLLMSSDRGRVLLRPKFCIDRSCGCAKVDLHIALIDDQVERVIEHDDHVELGMKSGCTLRPPLGFDVPSMTLELYTGRFTAFTTRREDLAAASAALNQLGLRIDGELLDELWRRQSLAKGAEPKPLARRPPKDHRLGRLVGWDEVCGDTRRDILWHEGKFIVCDDSYCPAPDCTCDEALVFFDRENTHEVGSVWVQFKTDDLKFVPSEGSSMQDLRAVWRAYVERWPNYRDHLRERYLALRDALHDALDVVPTELRPSESPRRSPPKIGRNEACPCGSGRKYKRCCGT
jgi:SEC-C motif